MLLDQVLGLPAGAVDRFINVLGIAALHNRYDESKGEAWFRGSIGFF